MSEDEKLRQSFAPLTTQLGGYYAYNLTPPSSIHRELVHVEGHDGHAEQLRPLVHIHELNLKLQVFARHRVVHVEDEAVVLKADARRRAAGGQLNDLAGLHLGLDGLELLGGRGELLDLTLVALPVSILARQLEHPLLSLGHLLDPSLQRGEQRALADWKRDGGVALASIVRDLTALGELQHVVDGNDLVVLDGGDRMKAPAARVSRHANRGAAEHG